MTSGREPVHGREDLGAIAGLTDHLEVRLAGEHAAEAVADDRVIVDDEDADRGRGAHGRHGASPTRRRWGSQGRGPRSAVPPPGSDSITRGPRPAPRAGASHGARTRRPARASGRSASNPTPSSRTSSATTSPMNDSVRRARPACACFATFASASWAVRSSVTSISGSSVDRLAGHGDLRRHRRSARTSSRDLAQGVGEGRRLERRRQRAVDRPARFAQAVARQPLGVREVTVVLLGSIQRMPGRLELGDHAGQALGDRVVDLARHPLALLEDARLAGLREELRVEPGVLGQRLLQPRDRLASLLVLLRHPLGEEGAGADDDRLDDDDHDAERPAGGRLRAARRAASSRAPSVTAMAATATGNGRSTVA